MQMYSFKSFSEAGGHQLRSLKTQIYLFGELQLKAFAHIYLALACAFALLTFKFEGGE